MTGTAKQPIDVLSDALDQTAEVLAAISPDHLSDPTPCEEWDVARLVAHVVATPRTFLVMAGGGEPDWTAQPPLPDDWAGEFRAGADDLLRWWREAGADSGSPPPADWQLAELAVHTWDLVRATGQSRDLDPQVAQRGLDFMSAALTAENRGEAFRPAVTLPDDAPVYDRLVAFAGRDPR